MSEEIKKFEPIFCAGDPWKANACLNWSHNLIDLYARGYKEAGDRLVEYVVEKQIDQDILIYPIVFLYRQYIELRLKEIIREGKVLLKEENDFPKNHKIDELWSMAKRIALRVFEDEEPDIKLRQADHVIKEFSQIDPDSFSFRYPETKQGEKTLDGVKHINIYHLTKHIEKLSEELEGVSMGISFYLDYQSEIQQ